MLPTQRLINDTGTDIAARRKLLASESACVQQAMTVDDGCVTQPHMSLMWSACQRTAGVCGATAHRAGGVDEALQRREAQRVAERGLLEPRQTLDSRSLRLPKVQSAIHGRAACCSRKGRGHLCTLDVR